MNEDKKETFKIPVGEQDIVIESPQGLLGRDEAFGIAAFTVQEQIVNGNIKITSRVYPCLICNREYKSQNRLGNHLKKIHQELIDKIKKYIKSLDEREKQPNPA